MNCPDLEDAILYHNKLYWEKNAPEISDIEYDKLIEQLRAIDPNNSLLLSIGKREIVGDKVIHKKPMLSLDKVYKEEDLFKWVKSKSRTSSERFLIQPKYDGISAKYEKRILSSRGDGIEGGNLTSRLPLINFETMKSSFDFLLGEIIIKNSEFESFKKYKTKSGNPFKNSRNAAAGIMGCDDVAFYFTQGLRVTLVDYDLHSTEVSSEVFERVWDSICQVFIKLDYPLDGIVVKLKDKEYADSLGYTDHHPRSQVAFKFSNQSRVSEIIDVEISQGKENLSAIAIVKPVDFDGVTVQRVKIPVTKPVDRSLPCLIEKGIAIGDIIEIERSGDVIPNVMSISPGANRKIIELNECPFCGGEIDIQATYVRCTNPWCFEKRLNKIMFSLETIGILGIGKVLLRKIMQKTDIQDFGFLMDMTQDQMEYTEIGAGNSKNLIAEINRCRKNKKASVLTALNVPSLGNAAAKLLLERYSVDEILEGIPYCKLIEIPGIGDVMAREISEGIEGNKVRLKEILAKFQFEEEPSKIYHSTICFTGKMRAVRSEMEKLAESHGFQVLDSVSKNLDFLVVGENAGSKLEKAKKLGINISTEDEFFASMNEIK